MKRRCLVLLVAVLPLLTACDSGGPCGSSGGAASSEYWFEALPEMVATSDVVVLGSLIDVRDGSIEGPPGQEIEHLDAVLDVQETLYGSADESSQLTVQTLKFVCPGREWREVGNRVLAFLKLSSETSAVGIYYPINEQSVFLVAGASVQATEPDLFSERVATMTIGEIRTRILHAEQAIAAGKVSPQAPLGG